mgnify:CR=1 FL=1
MTDLIGADLGLVPGVSKTAGVPTTDQPRPIKVSDKCEPMKPAAPVTTARLSGISCS